MTGIVHSPRKRSRHEAESPFWISFSDLMTAVTILFLVVMASALLSVTATVRHREAQERDRILLIDSCMSNLRNYTDTIPGVHLRDRSVDFGILARFKNDSSQLTVAQQEFLRLFVPKVLDIARAPFCRAFLKRIVVEGFASQSGGYLHNLDLSTHRSERVLCALLQPAMSQPLSIADQTLIKELFFVGGYSFNSTKQNDDDSRRIELKLEFYALKESRPALGQGIKPMSHPPTLEDLSCPIDAR